MYRRVVAYRRHYFEQLELTSAVVRACGFTGPMLALATGQSLLSLCIFLSTPRKDRTQALAKSRLSFAVCSIGGFHSCGSTVNKEYRLSVGLCDKGFFVSREIDGFLRAFHVTQAVGTVARRERLHLWMAEFRERSRCGVVEFG